MTDTNAVTPLNAAPTLPMVDIGTAISTQHQIAQEAANLVAHFTRLGYLRTLADKAHEIHRAADECLKVRSEMRNLRESMGRLSANIKDAVQDGLDDPDEAAQIQVEIEQMQARLVARVATLLQVQRARARILQAGMPSLQTFFEELKGVVGRYADRLAEMMLRIAATEAKLRIVNNALEVLSQLKVEELAQSVLSDIEKSLALLGSTNQVQILRDAGQLLVKQGQAIDDYLKVSSLINQQRMLDAELRGQRTERNGLEAEVVRANERLVYLQTAEKLEQHRQALAALVETVIELFKQLLAQLSAPGQPASRFLHIVEAARARL